MNWKIFTSSRAGLLTTLAVVFLIGIISMPAEEMKGDAISVRFETSNLIDNGRFGVSEAIATAPGVEPGQFFFHNVNGIYYPKYGVMNTLIYFPILGIEKCAREIFHLTFPDHVLFLNIHNLILSLGCAFLIYSIAYLFCSDQKTSFCFTLATVYTTFCWYYFRAQMFEIHQVFFFSGAFYFLIRFFRTTKISGLQKPLNPETGKHCLFLCSLFLSLLIFSKSIYVVILPVFASLILYSAFKNQKAGSRHCKFFNNVFWFFILPMLASCLLLLLVNNARYGSPFCNPYTQWEKEREPFSGDLWMGVWGYLFSSKFGVFACFPLALLALFKWREFFYRYRLESAIILMISIPLVLLNAKFINWSGEQCYGPRYLLPILPILSLPCVLMIREFISGSNSILKYALIGATALLLGHSLLLQLNVNKYPFLFFYTLEKDLFVNAEFANYFNTHNYGEINEDIDAFSRGKKGFPPIEKLKLEFPSEQDQENIAALNVTLLRDIRSNYYWSPKLGW